MLLPVVDLEVAVFQRLYPPGLFQGCYEDPTLPLPSRDPLEVTPRPPLEDPSLPLDHDVAPECDQMAEGCGPSNVSRRGEREELRMAREAGVDHDLTQHCSALPIRSISR